MNKKTKIILISISILAIISAIVIVFTREVPSTASASFENEFKDTTVDELRFIDAKLINNELNVMVQNTKANDYELATIDVVFKSGNNEIDTVKGYIGEKLSPNEVKNLKVKTTADLSNVDNIDYKIVDSVLITYDGNGGIPSKESDVISYKGSISNLASATKEHDDDYAYVLDGWYSQKDGGEKITADTKFYRDTTIYAHYIKTKRKCEVTITSTLNSDWSVKIDCIDGLTVDSGYGTIRAKACYYKNEICNQGRVGMENIAGSDLGCYESNSTDWPWYTCNQNKYSQGVYTTGGGFVNQKIIGLSCTCD